MNRDVVARAARHAALGDPVRLALVDELTRSDRSPVELRQLIGVESNLLSHHLDVLENVGLIVRTPSSGDGRRRYVHLVRSELPTLVPGRPLSAARALFVCTHNSARSQLAAALWRSRTGAPADSAGTHPSDKVHRGAVAAAARVGLDLSDATPRAFASVRKLPALVITVCDQAHEELTWHADWLHWSIPDPVTSGVRSAFDAVVADLTTRINTITTMSNSPKDHS